MFDSQHNHPASPKSQSVYEPARPKRLAKLLAVLLAVLVVASACSSSDDAADSSSSDTATSSSNDAGSDAAASGETVKVGVVTTLSTPAGYLGEDIANGLKLAQKLHGGDIPVEFLVEDDTRDPELASQIVDRFVAQDKTKIVTGIVFSNIAAAVVPGLVRDDVIYISPNAGPSTFAGKQCHKNFFSASWQNDNLSEAMGAYISNETDVSNIYLMAPNYQAGFDLIEGFKRFYNGGIAGEVYTELGQTDYAAEIAELRAANPDGVYIFYPGGMGISFLKQYAEAGLADTIPVYTTAASADDTLLDAVGESALGLINAAHWSPDLDNAANNEFVKAYEAEYGRTPTDYAAQGYDTGLLIISAVNAAGGVADIDAVREAIAAADFDAVRGDFAFGPNQFPVQNWVIREAYADGENITLRKIADSLQQHSDAYVGECNLAG